MNLLWIQAELIEMELLIAKGGSDVDRNYTTYSNDFSEENERDDMRQTVPILFEDFSSRIKEGKNGTRNMVCSLFFIIKFSKLATPSPWLMLFLVRRSQIHSS